MIKFTIIKNKNRGVFECDGLYSDNLANLIDKIHEAARAYGPKARFKVQQINDKGEVCDSIILRNK